MPIITAENNTRPATITKAGWSISFPNRLAELNIATPKFTINKLMFLLSIKKILNSQGYFLFTIIALFFITSTGLRKTGKNIEISCLKGYKVI